MKIAKASLYIWGGVNFFPLIINNALRVSNFIYKYLIDQELSIRDYFFSYRYLLQHNFNSKKNIKNYELTSNKNVKFFGYFLLKLKVIQFGHVDFCNQNIK